MMKQLLLSTALLCSSLVLFSPQEVAAQSHWGVTASFVPRWKPIPEIYGELWDVDFEPEGSEFRIGIVRGSDRGGDWSIMFIRNTIRTERVIDDTQFADFPLFSPVRFGSRYVVPEYLEITGIKYEKFTPFLTIKDRVQIGLTYGGGIGALKGSVEETVFDFELGFDTVTFAPIVWLTETVVMQREAKDFYNLAFYKLDFDKLDFVPIGSVEAAVAVILAPGLKARVTGGFNFPNTQVFSFTITYLFGS